jgi:hypothetical protein
LQTSELPPRLLERQKIRVGALPQREERKVRLTGAVKVVPRRERACETKMREWIQRGVDQFSAMVDDAPKLGGGFPAVFQLQLCLASHVRRPEFRNLGMIERPHRLEQLQATRRPPAPERGRRGNESHAL